MCSEWAFTLSLVEIKYLQKLLSCFENNLELSKFHGREQKTNCLCIGLSLSHMRSPALTNFTFSVGLRAFKALSWDARDSSPRRSNVTLLSCHKETLVKAEIGKQPTLSMQKKKTASPSVILCRKQSQLEFPSTGKHAKSPEFGRSDCLLMNYTYKLDE